MFIWNHRIIFRMPEMNIFGIFIDTTECISIECETCCRFSYESVIVVYWRDKMEYIDSSRELIFREIFCEKYTPERMTNNYQFIRTNMLKIFLEPYLPCRIVAILCIWHIYSNSIEVIWESREEPSFPAFIRISYIKWVIFEKLQILYCSIECFSTSYHEDLMFCSILHIRFDNIY